MKLIRLNFPFVVLFAVVVSVTQARADSFDDAVNHYLKGFGACQSANDFLKASNTAEAQQQLDLYLKFLSEAETLDPSILQSTLRDMDGNLKFCRRVATNIEVKQATPFIDMAFAQCELADQAYKEQRFDAATEHLLAFNTHKDEAWSVSDKLTDIFAIRNKVKRCERLEKRIMSAGKKHNALNSLIATVKDESGAYPRNCYQAQKSLKVTPINSAAVKKASKYLTRAKSNKKKVNKEKRVFNAFTKNPEHEAKAVIFANLKKGDKCVANVGKLITQKRKELKKRESTLDGYVVSLKNAAKQCEDARTITKRYAHARDEKFYHDAKGAYNKAQFIERRLRKTIRNDKVYLSNGASAKVKDIDNRLYKTTECLLDVDSVSLQCMRNHGLKKVILRQVS